MSEGNGIGEEEKELVGGALYIPSLRLACMSGVLIMMRAN